MRILVLAAWFRNLAMSHAKTLREQGHEVRVVTTGAQKHSVITGVHDGDIELDERLKSRRNPIDFAQAYNICRLWKADLAMVDVSWDPRFHLLASTAGQRIAMVHDATPHDQNHVRRGWKRLMEERALKTADFVGCYSEFVSKNLNTNKQVFQFALTSEIECDVLMKPERTGFAFVGRISEYKGIDFLLDAWALALERGAITDTLTILGSGNYNFGARERVHVINRAFTEQEAANLFSSVKGVILPYREASQSGVQVAAMRYGAPTIVTNRGALREFQPDPSGVVNYGDIESLANTIVAYSEARDVAQKSIMSQTRYQKHHSDNAVSQRLKEMINSL